MLFNMVNQWLTKHQVIAGLGLFFLSLIFFAWLEQAPTLSDPDSFYHIKIAQMMGQEGLVKNFPYLPFTTLQDGYIDHHLLYHLYLSPWVKFFPPLLGAKMGHIFLVALALSALYFLLLKFKVRGASWYIVFLLFIEPFVFRMGLIKAQPLSLLILFFGLYFITQNKYFKLTLLSFVYVWAYGGWFLLFVIAVLYVLVSGLDQALEQIKVSRLSRLLTWPAKSASWFKYPFDFIGSFIKHIFSFSHIKLLASVLSGLLLGLIINPYFPKNLEFYYIHIIKIALVNYQYVIGVGAEWYPYSVSAFFKNSALPLAFGSLALVIFLNHRRQFNLLAKYTLVLFLTFILATLKARRNIEYLAPWAVIFAAVVFSQAWEAGEIKSQLQEFKRLIKKLFLNNIYAQILGSLLVLALIAWSFYLMPYAAKKSLDNGIGFDYLQSASAYLKEHSQPGEIILHSDWDEFPMLFYHNSKNYYIAGLDPTFMYLSDQALYRKWADITRGERANELYNIIKSDFKASYVLAATDHQELIKNLANNFYFAKVYEDNEAVIYQVL